MCDTEPAEPSATRLRADVFLEVIRETDDGAAAMDAVVRRFWASPPISGSVRPSARLADVIDLGTWIERRRTAPGP